VAPYDVARLAEAAALGGAVAVKVDGPDAVRAVRLAVPGLVVLAVSIDDAHGLVRITPTVEHAAELVEAGADVVELEADAASRRKEGHDVADIVRQMCALGTPVKAGVACVADALSAQEAGAAMVSSSTMGYPARATAGPLPDIGLVALLCGAVRVPVVAERGYSTPDHVQAAFRAGAHSVVVGSAIADPVWLTKQFVAATPAAHRE